MIRRPPRSTRTDTLCRDTTRFRSYRAEIAGADHPTRLVGQFDPHEAVLFPLAGLGRGVSLGELAGEREHQRDRVFGGGDRITERGVHHHHALGRGGGISTLSTPIPARPTTLRLVAGAMMSCVTRSEERRVGHEGIWH